MSKENKDFVWQVLNLLSTKCYHPWTISGRSLMYWKGTCWKSLWMCGTWTPNERIETSSSYDMYTTKTQKKMHEKIFEPSEIYVCG